ncbi:MAG: glycosyltransferase family 2 protein [Lysobacterales bacterium]
MNGPRISVIITNYNRAELLADAVQSVIGQSWQDYEIVFVDDGSQDDSLQVIEAFRRQLPDTVRLFTHPGHANLGIVPTYELAMSKVRGEYVAFLEHDDRWDPGYLANKVEILQACSEVGVVFSPYRVVSSGWFGRDMMLRQFLLRSTISTNKPFDNFANLLQSNNVATFSCFMTRRSLLESLPRPPGAILAFDWWLLIHLSTRALFHYDPSSFTLWRWSRQSAIGRQSFETHRSQGCAFMELMYGQIAEIADQLPAAKRATFLESRRNFDLFLAYYMHPGPGSFARFFRRAPVWALASMTSLAINHLKFAGAQSG